MQHQIRLRLIVGVISALMLTAIFGVSWVRTEQAVHAKKAGHSAKHLSTKHSKAKHPS